MRNMVWDLVQEITNKRDSLLTSEFLKRGYTLDVLKSSNCWSNVYAHGQDEIVDYFVDGKCIMSVIYHREMKQEGDTYRFVETMSILN